MNRTLVLIGAIIVVAGVIMLAMLLGPATTPVAPVAGPPPDTAVQAFPPSRLWAVVIGLTLALGAGLIGLGMNRWGLARSRDASRGGERVTTSESRERSGEHGAPRVSA